MPAIPAQGQVGAAGSAELRAAPAAQQHDSRQYNVHPPVPPPNQTVQVDAYVRAVAWNVFMTGVPGFVPGLLKNGILNTKSVPLGSLLRLSFHDAGTFNR